MTELILPGALTLVDLIGTHESSGSLQVIGHSRYLNQSFNVEGATEEMVGNQYLVRLALNEQSPVPQTSYLIGSRIPSNFSWFAEHGKFVLLGKWNREKLNATYQERIPQFEDIDRYFKPGELTRAIFIKEGSTKKCGRMLLAEDGVRREVRDTPGRIVARGIHWLHCPALIVFESQENYQTLTSAANQRGFSAVTIDPYIPRTD